MKLYRAYIGEENILPLFRSKYPKPTGYYFALSVKDAIRWRFTMDGQDVDFKIAEFEIPGHIEVMAAREGFYSEWPRMCKYFVGRLWEVVSYIKKNPMKIRFDDGEIIVNDRALPEVILREHQKSFIKIINPDVPYKHLL